jgi:hypothetical protein
LIGSFIHIDSSSNETLIPARSWAFTVSLSVTGCGRIVFPLFQATDHGVLARIASL